MKWRGARASTLLAMGATFVTLTSSCLSQAQGLADTPRRPGVVLEGVAVVDVVRGEVVGSRTVTIGDGRIAAVGEPGAVDIPAGAVRVDGRGRYVMPGLVDMHVHLFNNATRRRPNDWAFPLFVANGITGVREMRAEPTEMPVVGVWRFQASRGELVAPRILAAGAPAGGSQVAISRERVRDAKKLGTDFIKIFSYVWEREWRAILDEARAAGLPVCGHIPADVGLLDAATAGQRSNEHLTQVYEACSAKETEWLDPRKKLQGKELRELCATQDAHVLESFNQATCERVAADLAKTDQVQVPTLVLPYFESRGAPANLRDDPRRRYLRGDEQARWERIFEKGYPRWGNKLAARRWEVSRQIVKTLHAAGVRILAGTDAPMPQVYPGFSLHKELELLVEAGLTPLDALRATTIWPAEFLGESESAGSIAVGKRADLVLLDGNPLADISHTQRIHAVVLNGRLFPRADLDKLLERASAGQKPEVNRTR